MLEIIYDQRTDGTHATAQESTKTRVHELKCSGKDVTSTWIPLNDLKQLYPIKTAKYASAMDLV